MKNEKLMRYLVPLCIISIPFLELGLILLITMFLGSFITWTLIVVSSVAGFIYIFFKAKKFWKYMQEEFKIIAESMKQSVESQDISAVTNVSMKMFTGHILALSFVLFFIPGFITDGLGYFVLSPLFRKIIKRKMQHMIEKAVEMQRKRASIKNSSDRGDSTTSSQKGIDAE